MQVPHASYGSPKKSSEYKDLLHISTKRIKGSSIRDPATSINGSILSYKLFQSQKLCTTNVQSLIAKIKWKWRTKMKRILLMISQLSI